MAFLLYTNRKIIVNTPFIKIPAGVANHFLGLRQFFTKDVIYNQYLPSSYIRRKIKFKIFYIPIIGLSKGYDLIKFIVLLFWHRFPIILLNPSFGESAIRRDGIFLILAKKFGCKVGVFFHGWNREYFESVLERNEDFTCLWNRADIFFVLANEFKDNLIKLGIDKPVHLTSTKVDDNLLVEVTEKKTIDNVKNILFLARIEQEKGIFIAINSFEILHKKYKFLKMHIVGSGSMLREAKAYVESKNQRNIVFTGTLIGDDLRNEYLKADLYVLPTTHGEGMPTTVLEAMAFGLPVITRPVGGLVDFFENGKMGYLIGSLDPREFANCIEHFMLNVDEVIRISDFNMKYSREHFMASKIAPLLEDKLSFL